MRPAINTNDTFYPAHQPFSRGWLKSVEHGCVELYPPFNTGWLLYARSQVQKPASVSTKPWRRWHLKPLTPYSASFLRVNTPPFIFSYWSAPVPSLINCDGHLEFEPCYRGNDAEILPGYIPDLSSFDGFDPSLPGKASNKMLESIKSEHTAQLGVALAERRQTERLLVSTIERIADNVRYARGVLRGKRKWNDLPFLYAERDRLKRKNGGKLSRREEKELRIPELWLEYQYGWKPLMQDVVDSFRAVDFFQREDLYLLSKKVVVGGSTPPPPVQVYTNGPANLTVSFEASLLNQQLTKMQIYYELQTSGLPILSSVGFANPASIVWEIMPWSFVFDWFYPLGNWFNLFDATVGKSFHSGYFTEVTRYAGECKPILAAPFPHGYVFRFDNGRGSFRVKRFRRTILGAFPSPVPPAFKNPCSPTHVANALALLATALGLKDRRRLRV